MKNKFDIPETVTKTELWIRWKAVAHQSLVDLENSRDYQLFKLHRLGHNNTRDRDLLNEQSEAVE